MLDAQELYKDTNALKNSILPNESKANELRKLFEKLLHSKLRTDLVEGHMPLVDLIDNYILQEHKRGLQYICHNLRKDLNPWSHHSSAKLNDNELEDYFARFKNIVGIISGESDTSNENKIKPFSLDSIGLNAKQKEAVLSSAKITLVNAGPGTGKTYLIVGRVLEELRKNPEMKIFGLSFTNKASDELQYKIDDKIFCTNLVKYRDNIYTGTIHSFALKLIQAYYEFRGRTFDFVVIDETEFKDIQDEYGKDAEKVERYLTENKMLTFDKIITLFINTMQNNEGFQNFVADKLDEIVIDEAQDLDKLQYKILHLLYKNNNDLKLFFVGDQRQNIYAFKGGSLNNILEYFSNETSSSVVELEHSYRCPQTVLSFVNSLNFSDCKNIKLNNAAGNNGNTLSIQEYLDKEDEAMAIAKLIIGKHKEGAKFSDMAIIYSSTFYFKDILEGLNAFQIPFKVFGGQYFIDSDIRLLRLLLNLIYTNNSYSLSAIQKLMTGEEFKGENLYDIIIQLASMDSSKRRNHKKLYHILNFVREKQSSKQTPLDIVNDFILFAEKEKLFDDKTLEKYYSFKIIIENNLTLDNYDKLKLSFTPNHPEFVQFYSRSDEIVPCEHEDDSDFVTVTTVHSAKGLEWDNVIIPGMSQDSFPRWFKDEEERKKEFSNEVKKFYVACTRSKQNLYFTRPKTVKVYSKKWNKHYTFKKPVSEFIAGLM